MPSMKTHSTAMIRSILLMLMLSVMAGRPLRAQSTEGGGANEPVPAMSSATTPTFAEALRSAAGKEGGRKGRKLVAWVLKRAENVVKVTHH